MDNAKKYNFIYKITNIINNKYYIGAHSTNDINDGYCGSGLKLRRSIKKYGIENFKIEIIEYLPNRLTLMQREKEIVNEQLLHDPKCLNLKQGGSGGLCNEEHAYKFSAAGGRKVRQILAARHFEKLKNDPIYREWYKERCKLKHSDYWRGKKHSPETIAKMKKSAAGRGKGKITHNLVLFG